MAKGDTQSAKKTLQILNEESQRNPHLHQLSKSIISKWEEYKQGAHPRSDHKNHEMH